MTNSEKKPDLRRANEIVSDQSQDHLLPSIPPEWMPIPGALGWITRMYGVASKDVGAELLLEVRSRTIKHRISQVKANPPSLYRLNLPPGIVEADSSGERLIVRDWEIAQADWATGTVGGWPRKDGERERVSIEIQWASVQHFAVLCLPRWKKVPAQGIEPKPSDTTQALGAKREAEDAPLTVVSEMVGEGRSIAKSPRRSGYEVKDAAIIQEMKTIVDQGNRSLWAAAQQLAPKAEGSSHLDSREKRLVRKFNEKYGNPIQ